jgi:hypothetical protein
MTLDCRARRLELPRLASPLVKRVAWEASPSPAVLPAPTAGRGQRLSPVETKTLPALAPVRRLPSITRPVMQAPAVQASTAQTSAADERTIRDLAARLALLLHARECCQGRQTPPQDTSAVAAATATATSKDGCQLRNCGVARGVLDHCQECFLRDGECHVSCAQAKRLLRHFRLCRARGGPAQTACRLCAVLHADFPWALRHAASLSPVYLCPKTNFDINTTANANGEPAVRLCRVVSDESDRPAKRRR